MCAPTTAPPDLPDCRLRFVPRWSLRSVGAHLLLRCTAIAILPCPPPPPPCDIPSGCGFFTGSWTVTHSSLRMLRRVAAFCRPLRPVLLLVPSSPPPKKNSTRRNIKWRLMGRPKGGDYYGAVVVWFWCACARALRSADLQRVFRCAVR